MNQFPSQLQLREQSPHRIGGQNPGASAPDTAAAGFTLIEILVAMLITSVIMVSVSATLLSIRSIQWLHSGCFNISRSSSAMRAFSCRYCSTTVATSGSIRNSSSQG